MLHREPVFASVASIRLLDLQLARVSERAWGGRSHQSADKVSRTLAPVLPVLPVGAGTVATEMLSVEHRSPFMTFTFNVNENWMARVPEVVHEDGTARAQVLQREYNPRYYDLMTELECLTGNGVALNTSLNRRGEPMVCSPMDALNMFYGSDLKYLIMEGVLVCKHQGDSLEQP